jgi:hypothetical protein
MNNLSSERISLLSPLVLLYTVLAAAIFFFSERLATTGADVRELHGANTIVFLATLAASVWLTIQFQRSGGQAALKGLYGGFMIRFFLIALSAFVYILLKRKEVNVPGLIGGAIFYVLYWLVEIRSLRSKMKSTSTHA